MTSPVRSPWLRTALVAAATGIASAALTTSWLATSAPAGRGPNPRSDPGSGPSLGAEAARRDDELRLGLEALREETRALAARIERLERHPIPEGRQPLVVEASPTAELPREDAAARPAVDLPPELLLDQVGEALSRIRAEEQAEEQRRADERQAQRLEERLARLSDELGLAPQQVRELRTLWIAQEERRQELRLRLQESRDRQAYLEERKEQHAANEEELARILTPSQLEGLRQREERRDDSRTRDGTRDRTRGGRRGR